MTRKAMVLVLVALVSLGSAQSAHAWGVLGVRGGASFASVIDEKFKPAYTSPVDLSARTGLAATGFWTVGVGWLGIQPEVSYIQKGAKNSLTGEQLDLNYLQTAVVLKVGVPLRWANPHLFIGGGADFEIDTVDQFDIETKSPDYVGIAGLDIIFVFDSFSAVIDARYNQGFENVIDSSNYVDSMTNTAWVISTGFGWHF